MKEANMEQQEAAKKIIDELMQRQKSKSKFYFNDLAKIIDEKPRAAKKIITQMVEEGQLVYWSSGSTTMYGLPHTGKQAAAENEEE
jgi:DeoR/GlpR family transcriptional regulator of sugar metabolism